MSYKTVVLDHASKTKDMASAVEHKANEMAEKGFELITMSITHSGKAILVFKAPDKPVKTSDDVKGKSLKQKIKRKQQKHQIKQEKQKLPKRTKKLKQGKMLKRSKKQKQ